MGLGITDDVVGRILPTVLAQFARSHPAVQVDVEVGRSKDLLARLDEGELDLALVMAGGPGQAARGEIVHSEPLVWAGREDGVAVQRTPLPVTLAQQGARGVGLRSMLLIMQGELPDRLLLRSLCRSGSRYAGRFGCDGISKSLVRPPLKRLHNESLPR